MLTELARQLRREHGIARASWVFDGTTLLDTYRAFLKGWEDGDPEILDLYAPPNLSGEWGGGFDTADLYRELGIGSGDERAEECCRAYEFGASDGFYSELQRMALYQLA